MFTPLILFLGLTVATAVIAHWSDNLGKKLGKKRVSLFGLRPRTTATILTVASSWGIMLFTLVALLVAVAPLRRALFSYDRERAQAQIDREESKTAIAAAQVRLEATQNGLKSAQAQLKSASYAVETSRKSAEKAREVAQKARENAKNAEESARKRTREAQNRVTEAQNRVTGAQQRLAAAQKAETAAQKAEAVAKNQARRDQGLSRRATGELRVARGNLSAAQGDLRATQAQFRRAQSVLTAAQTQVRTVNAQLTASSRQLQSSRKQLQVSRKQLVETEADLRVRSSQVVAFAGNDAPVKVGQTFAARVIAARQKPEAIEAQLRELLRQGRELFAQSEDAEPTPIFPGGTTLQLVAIPVDDASGKTVRLEGQRLLQFYAREIAGQTQVELISARLMADRNYLALEKQIGVRFEFVPIRTAFTPGETLAERTINGGQGDAEIFRELLDLTDLGQKEAEKRGINPPRSLTEPSFYADGTNVRIFETLRLIQASKARVRVSLVAARALSTVEPLQVRFEVENANLNAPTS